MALSPTNGFVFLPADDPLGNGEETLGVGFKDADGTVKRCGVWIVLHGGTTPILVLGSADSDAAYPVTSSPTTVTVPGSSLQIRLAG